MWSISAEHVDLGSTRMRAYAYDAAWTPFQHDATNWPTDAPEPHRVAEAMKYGGALGPTRREHFTRNPPPPPPPPPQPIDVDADDAPAPPPTKRARAPAKRRAPPAVPIATQRNEDDEVEPETNAATAMLSNLRHPPMPLLSVLWMSLYGLRAAVAKSGAMPESPFAGAAGAADSLEQRLGDAAALDAVLAVFAALYPVGTRTCAPRIAAPFVRMDGKGHGRRGIVAFVAHRCVAIARVRRSGDAHNTLATEQMHSTVIRVDDVWNKLAELCEERGADARALRSDDVYKRVGDAADRGHRNTAIALFDHLFPVPK
ncbi:hypothetical protein LCGC14_1924560 [marine sediment metagenome]|uniref:Uncharacterized protein n=1 Tax=marine sediment metagenome TaxID=412755 RepID=A0A0F9FQF7_9ZZZZ